jgi:hypothetical protein
MGFGYVFGATPAVESTSLGLKLFNLLEDAPFEVAHSKLEPLTCWDFIRLLIFWDFFKDIFFDP